MFHCVTPNGDAIRDSREKQGISLRQLGQRAHINFTHLWRVEKGLSGASEDKLQRIAGALGESIENITLDTPQETK